MDIAQYSPGLHKLLTLRVPDSKKLTDLAGFLAFAEGILQQHGLIRVGSSSHVFDNGSYTAAICLAESHICIHTWPEYSQLTFDVYLCNYIKDNSHTVREVAGEFVRYFDAEILNDFEINR